MYAARVQERDLTFVVSGMLWQRSLVMQDLQTKTLWSHLLGKAMRGRLKGESLRVLPSSMTDWKTWKAQHPQTTVLELSRTSRDYQRDFYHNPAQFVIGMARGGQARAWPFDQLLRETIVNDQFAGQPVLIVFTPESSTALVYDRQVDGRTLTFQWRDSALVDEQTETQWDPHSGAAGQGPLAGSRLNREIGIVSYVAAWRDFHPTSSYWKAN